MWRRSQRPPAARDVVGLVGVQLGRALAPPAVRRLDGRDGVEQFLEDDRVVAVGPGQEAGQRDAAPVAHNVALRARFAAIRRVGAGAVAPPLAGTLAESSEARLQSIWPASPRRSRSSRWRRPRPRPPASRAAGASRSPRSRSPSPAAASPRECPIPARRRCRSEQRGRRRAVGRPWAWAARAAAAGRRRPTTRR